MDSWYNKHEDGVHTTGDEAGQQAGTTAHSQEGQLRDLAGAVECKQSDGACRHLYQAKNHLGQEDVHSKVWYVERQAIVNKHIGKPKEIEKERGTISLTLSISAD